MDAHTLLLKSPSTSQESKWKNPIKCIAGAFLILSGLTMLVAGALMMPACPVGGIALMLGGICAITLGSLLLAGTGGPMPDHKHHHPPQSSSEETQSDPEKIRKEWQNKQETKQQERVNSFEQYLKEEGVEIPYLQGNSPLTSEEKEVLLHRAWSKHNSRAVYDLS